MRRCFPLLLLLCFSGISHAQERGRTRDSTRHGKFYLFLHDTAGRDNVFYHAALGYNVPIVSNFNTAGYGLQFAYGLNLAYPLSRKWTAGIFVGVKWSEFLKSLGRFNKQFSADINSNIITGSGAPHDSVLVNYFADQTGIRSQGGGATFMEAGIYLSYPKPYLPLIKIFRARTIDGVEAYQYDGSYTMDFMYATSRRSYGISASWTVLQMKKYGHVSIAAWAIQCKLDALNLEGLWLDDFITPQFANKYDKLWRAGITVGVEVY